MNNPARVTITLFGAALIALLVWWLGNRSPAQPEPAHEHAAAERAGAGEPAAPGTATPPVPPAEPAAVQPGPGERIPPIPPREVEPYAGEIRVESGETLVFDAASLEAGRPVVLTLALGEASQTDEPRPVRLIGPKGEVHERQAPLADARGSARFEIDSAWLVPGLHIVEVKTTERSHFPLRRYALEVR